MVAYITRTVKSRESDAFNAYEVFHNDKKVHITSQDGLPQLYDEARKIIEAPDVKGVNTISFLNTDYPAN